MKKLTKAQLAEDNAALRAAVKRMADELALLGSPLCWTLRIDENCLKIQLSFEEAKLWAGIVRTKAPTAKITIVPN